jgi:hypothetical protein
MFGPDAWMEYVNDITCFVTYRRVSRSPASRALYLPDPTLLSFSSETLLSEEEHRARAESEVVSQAAAATFPVS